MGIMTVATMTNTTWTYTCKLCKVLRTAMSVAFVGLIALGETAGRARAAAELSRQGYHGEARALMTLPMEYKK